jgi:hypothetical protein
MLVHMGVILLKLKFLSDPPRVLALHIKNPVPVAETNLMKIDARFAFPISVYNFAAKDSEMRT